jgi:photosystem II stability/assembly factor-like uncharacterized protein
MVVFSFGISCQVASSGPIENREPFKFPKQENGSPKGLDKVIAVDQKTWLVGDYARLWRTTDAGKTWISVYPLNEDVSDPVGVRCISFVDPVIGFAIFKNQLIGSQDGGQSWHVIFEFDKSLSPRECSFATPARGWIVGSVFNPRYAEHPEEGKTFGKAFTTADGGKTWEQRKIGNPVRGRTEALDLRDVAFLSESAGFIVGYSGLFSTLDGGQTWEHSSLRKGDEYSKISVQDGGTLFITSMRSKRHLLSTNAGGAWQAFDLPISFGDTLPSFYLTPNDAIGAVVDKLYVSVDRGQSWKPVGLDTAEFGDLQLVNTLDGNLLLIGVHPITHETLAYISIDHGTNWTRL